MVATCQARYIIILGMLVMGLSTYKDLYARVIVLIARGKGKLMKEHIRVDLTGHNNRICLSSEHVFCSMTAMHSGIL